MRESVRLEAQPGLNDETNRTNMTNAQTNAYAQVDVMGAMSAYGRAEPYSCFMASLIAV